MTRAEIRNKFDEIIAFSEIEKFLDTPVKRYSSGMYVRLAFAVAAHLEPDILIVDEVLAVGDAAFQEKCIGKINSVAKQSGRTVLFVSHNQVAVRRLCSRALWLENGRLLELGEVPRVSQAYLRSSSNNAGVGEFASGRITGDGKVDLLSYRVTNSDGLTEPPPGTKDDVLIHVRLNAMEPISQPAVGISLINESGTLLTSINTVEQGISLPLLPKGESTICIRVKNTPFLPGNYTSTFWIMNSYGHIYAQAEQAIRFKISQAPLYGTREIDDRWGCVYSDIAFSIEEKAGTPQ
jgi:lipopolysaccharide transport system ATP-binding protein